MPAPYILLPRCRDSLPNISAESSLPRKKWPTKNCWFHLLVTLVGMSVVDCYQIYLNHDKQKYKKWTLFSLHMSSAFSYECDSKQKEPTLAADLNTLNGQEMRHERITNHLGEICRQPTTTQINKHGRATGNSITSNCYICQKYMKKANVTKYVQTAFRCYNCKIPVCKTDRSNEQQPMPCYLEHKSSKDSKMGCLELDSKRRTFPEEKRVLL